MHLRAASLLALFLAGTNVEGFISPLLRARTRRPRPSSWTNPTPTRSGQLPARSAAGVGPWENYPDTLLRIGKAGVKESHLKSLTELLAHHGMVKVKLSDHRLSAETLAVELGAAHNCELVDIHPTGRFLLFTKTDKKPSGGNL